MSETTPVVDAAALAYVRGLINPRARPVRHLPAVLAAVFLCVASLGFAVSLILPLPDFRSGPGGPARERPASPSAGAPAR